MAINLTIKTAGGEYPVEVLGDGRFSCNYDGSQYISDTYAKLADNVKNLAKRAVSMALPGTLMGTAHSYSAVPGKMTFTDITVTGIHSGNGNMMYRYDSSPKALYQSDRWSNSLLRRLTPDEQNQMRVLKDTAERAQREYDKYVEHFKLPREQKELLALWNGLRDKQTATAPKAKAPAKAKPKRV